ncbi:MAG: hypothetical protein CVT76_10110, partial [Alphaproteobacteria bacterium HGW-Alphaproteobacteria-15]
MMMKKFGIAGLIIGAYFGSPALALEHAVTIEHAGGPIAADYQGTIAVDLRQVGAAGVAGRPSTLRCNWTASLAVERTAKVGETLQTRNWLNRDDVASGSRPGWCKPQDRAIKRLVESKREEFRA